MASSSFTSRPVHGIGEEYSDDEKVWFDLMLLVVDGCLRFGLDCLP
jgi:hypothetical protein